MKNRGFRRLGIKIKIQQTHDIRFTDNFGGLYFKKRYGILSLEKKETASKDFLFPCFIILSLR
jgi:hypothetical protein